MKIFAVDGIVTARKEEAAQVSGSLCIFLLRFIEDIIAFLAVQIVVSAAVIIRNCSDERLLESDSAHTVGITFIPRVKIIREVVAEEGDRLPAVLNVAEGIYHMDGIRENRRTGVRVLRIVKSVRLRHALFAALSYRKAENINEDILHIAVHNLLGIAGIRRHSQIGNGVLSLGRQRIAHIRIIIGSGGQVDINNIVFSLVRRDFILGFGCICTDAHNHIGDITLLFLLLFFIVRLLFVTLGAFAFGRSFLLRLIVSNGLFVRDGVLRTVMQIAAAYIVILTIGVEIRCAALAEIFSAVVTVQITGITVDIFKYIAVFVCYNGRADSLVLCIRYRHPFPLLGGVDIGNIALIVQRTLITDIIGSVVVLKRINKVVRLFGMVFTLVLLDNKRLNQFDCQHRQRKAHHCHTKEG